MNLGRVIWVVALIVVALVRTAMAAAPGDDVVRVLKPGEKLDDPRLGPPRSLGDKYHPWAPATNKVDWNKQSQAIRERVLVSAGLWPMLPKVPLNPVIHGKIDRGDYTVEKVFFASLPGHYVSGNLYRPKTISGKIPGVLGTHGHGPGRFQEVAEKRAADQIKQGAEATMAAARHTYQARMVQLARMGCTVFHYDMVGKSDSKPLVYAPELGSTSEHAAGFTDVEAELRLQSALGLQTFNSIRALDFLLSLPEVDPTRIGVTGESGGGTQTFMLGAVDPRPAVAFPAVMVSTNMQGGCVCENADLLRIGINNVAIAALFAPKPLAMSGAHDWTIDIETKGLPELKQVYALYSSADKVHAKCFPQFGHNYNRVAREMMYHWFNTHLNLGRPTPIVEQEFQPISPKDLSVFDANHPRPNDAKSATELRKSLTEITEKQLADLLSADATGLDRYRDVVGTAARVMLDPGRIEPDAVQQSRQARVDLDPDLIVYKGLIVRRDDRSQIPYIAIEPRNFRGTAVFWIDGQGKSHLFGNDGKPNVHVAKLLAAGNAVASVDLFLTGEFLEPGKPAARPAVNAKYAGFTYGYNRTLLSNRVRDVLATIAVLLGEDNVKTIKLVGTGDAGPVALLASCFLRDLVHEVVADARGHGFRKVVDVADPLFLPGGLKYGGLGGLTGLAAPLKLTVCGTDGMFDDEIRPLSSVYKAAGGTLALEPMPLTPEMVIARLLE